MGSPPQIECHFLFPSFEDFEMRLCSSRIAVHTMRLETLVLTARGPFLVLVVTSRHIVPNVSAPVGLVRYRARLWLMCLRTCYT